MEFENNIEQLKAENEALKKALAKKGSREYAIRSTRPPSARTHFFRVNKRQYKQDNNVSSMQARRELFEIWRHMTFREQEEFMRMNPIPKLD